MDGFLRILGMVVTVSCRAGRLSLPAASHQPQLDRLRRAQTACRPPVYRRLRTTAQDCASLARRRSMTGSGTSPLTSPPYLATSLIRLEDRNEYSGFVVMNRVSTLAMR